MIWLITVLFIPPARRPTLHDFVVGPIGLGIVIAYAVIALVSVLEPWMRRLGTRETDSDPDSEPCPVCGYDLRASADRCPECGTRLPYFGDRQTPTGQT